MSTEFTLTVVADTTLAPDAVEHLVRSMADQPIAAACGFVVPRGIRSLWERGRYIEYLFSFGFYKVIQDSYERPLFSSGCFSMCRTEELVRRGGGSSRTMAEDLDLTWSYYEAGLRARFVPKTVCYPIEPGTLRFMGRQLRRWSHGFLQNVRLHWRRILALPMLRVMVAVAVWDALIASPAFNFVLPVLAILISPLFLLGYVVDFPAVAVPVMVLAVRRREVGRALLSLPSFLVLRAVNAFFKLKAAWREWVRGRPLIVHEKGY